MRRLAPATVALAWVLGTGTAWAGAVVRIPAEVVVRSDDVRLGDVAEIDAESRLAERLRAVRLGPAPTAGRVQPLDLEYLRLRLRQHHIDPATVEFRAPDRIALTRAVQVLTGQALVEAATRQGLEHLERLDPHGGPYALVPLSRPADLRIPAGETELSTRIDVAPPYTSLAAVLSVRVDGREQQMVPLSFRVGRYQEVLVAVRALEPSVPLSPGDFAVQSRTTAEAPAGALPSLAELADLELARPLKAGEILTRRSLRPRLIVRRGDLVTLSFAGRGFHITTLGRALADARRGEPVRVVNPTSKREILGMAEAPGVVRVGGDR